MQAKRLTPIRSGWAPALLSVALLLACAANNDRGAPRQTGEQGKRGTSQ